MKNYIYYYSGTGNSLQAAKTIAEKMGGALLINMKNNPADYPAIDADCVGFCFPVYAGSLPSHVKNFIGALDLNYNAYTFCVSTYGGASCAELHQANDIISAKGGNLTYAASVKAVANYIGLYNLSTNYKATEAQSENHIVSVAEEIALRQTKKVPRLSFSNKIISFLGNTMQKKFPYKDKKYSVSDDCTSCGLCESLCLAKNISMQNGKPSFHHSCEQCMACIQYCPKKAINYAKKTLVRTRYRNSKVSVEEMKALKIIK